MTVLENAISEVSAAFQNAAGNPICHVETTALGIVLDYLSRRNDDGCPPAQTDRDDTAGPDVYIHLCANHVVNAVGGVVRIEPVDAVERRDSLLAAITRWKDDGDDAALIAAAGLGNLIYKLKEK